MSLDNVWDTAYSLLNTNLGNPTTWRYGIELLFVPFIVTMVEEQPRLRAYVHGKYEAERNEFQKHCAQLFAQRQAYIDRLRWGRGGDFAAVVEEQYVALPRPDFAELRARWGPGGELPHVETREPERIVMQTPEEIAALRAIYGP